MESERIVERGRQGVEDARTKVAEMCRWSRGAGVELQGLNAVDEVGGRRQVALRVRKKLSAKVLRFRINFADITGFRRRRCGTQRQLWELVPENFLVDFVDVDNVRRSHVGSTGPEHTLGVPLVFGEVGGIGGSDKLNLYLVSRL